MKNEQILSLSRDLYKYMTTSNLAAYCGLYKVRTADGRNPEECGFIKKASQNFFDSEFDKFKELINKLHKELNE